MRAEPASLELRIEHHFSDPELLSRALTHSSLANESRNGGTPLTDNEQLEFLGDSVLGFLISEALVRRYPGHSEGELSRQKAHLVSAAHLHGVARHLDLGSHLELGRSEEMSGGRAKKTLLVDALEAVIAAIYLDAGVDAARRFVHGFVLDAPLSSDFEAGTDIQPAITNFKSALQELAQSRGLPQPRYSVVREKGPEHSKVFTVEVRVGKEWSGQADGRTKKVAAQRAARGVYDKLREQAAAEAVSNSPQPPGDVSERAGKQ
jgi:ribonuclease-3